MAGWRRLVVAALLQLAFSRVLTTENCYGRGKLPKGSGYFDCAEPRLKLSNSRRELVMDFRNRHNLTLFRMSLKRTAHAFHFSASLGTGELLNSTKLDLDSANEVQLNIDCSSVHAKTHGTWRKMDIPETDEIFSFYFRSFPPNPAFCIVCCGGDITSNDKTTEQDIPQNFKQGRRLTTQGETGAAVAMVMVACVAYFILLA
ncbi:uncharacterized protein LOC125040130 [Penaeus chinensis]|uniref:uncharacterized protein LOC125040130 n=1 Tax=Penaeus chinensis TaxID=139456 RepID=UPI001FB5FEC0|nr:uncharacterized protein LOC125040130 [Penaeus chinensis]